jgi:pyruvate kinase
LLKALKKLRAKLGLIVKIETQRGFRNLPAILLAAMRTHPVGVMIARGDLAIEAGWRNLAGIQEEILWLCEAAHLPIIWATQVLETLAKKGIPSRAEISDAAMAQQAECVMLNKGPHILETVRMLDDILKSMEDYHQKKAPMLPALPMLQARPAKALGGPGPALKAAGELSFKWDKQ